jgi:hypothetical protein
MTTLNTGTATLALAYMNIKLPNYGLNRNFGLILGNDFQFCNIITATIGTFLGKWRIIVFVDCIGRWRRSMAMFSVVVAGFPAWFLGIFLLSFAKRSCLTFPFLLR